MDEYKLDNSKLPNIFSSLTSKKINNYNNSAYIDSFFSYLGMIIETIIFRLKTNSPFRKIEIVVNKPMLQVDYSEQHIQDLFDLGTSFSDLP